MTRFFRIARCLGALWLCLVTLTAADLGDMVLCTGQDGHVALERSYVLDGAGNAICAVPGRIDASSVEFHCGKCVDQPLSISASQPAQTGRNTAGDLPSAGSLIAGILPPPSSSRSPLPAFAPHGIRQPALAGTRTVVLRI